MKQEQIESSGKPVSGSIGYLSSLHTQRPVLTNKVLDRWFLQTRQAPLHAG